MTDVEKGNPDKVTASDPGDEAAAAKLWAVYVSEADKYDKALVESWKSDMDGLLIFVSVAFHRGVTRDFFNLFDISIIGFEAALFSAILAAFLIESYKTLNSDSGDLTVQLLTQIFDRLNGTSTHPLPSPPFTPPATSLICNALWFISLGLSLACALIATLVQQWAREFLHKADMRSAPVIRAHVFSYLYYGMKDFQMHTVVEIIPLLLHASLGLFFCGLVAFLIPVNIAMAAIAIAILFAVAVVYSTLTLLPLWYMDCPYRTPLSGGLWRGLQLLQTVRRQWHAHANDSPPAPYGIESMVEAMSRVAMNPSVQRAERDQKALVWTMKSLADDMELEPFVEAIPDLLWGPRGRRHAFDNQIRGLLKNPDVLLHHRIGALLKSCSSGILTSDASKRRRITCYRALWAVAHLSSTWGSDGSDVAVDFSYICKGATLDNFPLDDLHGPSVWALMQWSTFGTVQQQLLDLRKSLEHSLSEVHPGSNQSVNRQSKSLDLNQIKSTINAIERKFPSAPCAPSMETTPFIPPLRTPGRSIASAIQESISDIM
ncbi:hypothetical protein DFH06DRAFT_1408597 [Mycena polygramma]|nr:hypothetical protein DFH06DRAFT_1408597 [Mycena polygramma]